MMAENQPNAIPIVTSAPARYAAM
ncbi:hypothetical protein RB2654_14550 [Rhodobacterales bacterium HTCC2654]|uniref:Uncharacterized protein n=1 Tax=Maritimibacter alkaliphilus HTCC2654 TaxID=314271 RepID=A3VGV9_9RHOB|nr:hypothetical protein RB2654_14550 [Rhodobacterales bacterium HTCC2654] [Maritimibacter alkaliphilus HTCC2654]